MNDLDTNTLPIGIEMIGCDGDRYHFTDMKHDSPACGGSFTVPVKGYNDTKMMLVLLAMRRRFAKGKQP